MEGRRARRIEDGNDDVVNTSRRVGGCGVLGVLDVLRPSIRNAAPISSGSAGGDVSPEPLTTRDILMGANRAAGDAETGGLARL